MGAVVVGAIALGLAVSTVETARAAESDVVYELVNNARESNGRVALYRNGALEQIAVKWANQMAAQRQMSHNPNYFSQIPAGWIRAGENVAFGQPTGAAVHRAWMESPGHKANILGDYTDVGIAFVVVGGTSWSVEVFAKYANRTPPGANPFVKALYADVLDRAPGDAEIRHWTGRLADGVTPVQVASGFVDSDEYRLARIRSAYETILNRAGDEGGVMSWLTGMRRGVLGPDDVEKAFLSSQEFYNISGGTDANYVATLYRRLLLREANASEIRGWALQVAENGRSAVVAAFWNSMETALGRVRLMYLDYLGREPDSAGAREWAAMAILSGDGAVRWAIIGSLEYRNRATTRFP